MTLGYGLNAVFSKILKEILAQPRPPGMCHALGTCHSYGMPSTHSQFMIFCASYATFYYIYKRHTMIHEQQTMKSKNTRPTFEQRRFLSYQTRVEQSLLWIMALTVASARVSLGYHSISQVLVGGILGIICAYIWFRCVRILYRYGICGMICEYTEYVFKCPVVVMKID